MIIAATLENIETGAVEVTEVECQNYTDGFAQLRRTVQEGMRLPSVLPKR
ncbi:hypothetical protein [Arthrobacter glacialis]|nr:hypothetical protein [Arthrobacter glacialis]